MADLRIAHVHAREILDSRGRPTVEADVRLEDGALGRASVPSGASTGRHEAVELRDGDEGRHRGLGVRRAVANVTDEIGPAVRGLDAADQERVDATMRDLDGTADRHRLGANALLAVSLAACRAAAQGRGVPLYRHIATLAGTEPTIPLPMVNMLSGGLHAGRQVDIQDVLAIPVGAGSFAEAMEHVCAIHARLGDMVRDAGHPPLIADEGGWAPPLDSSDRAIEWVDRAISDEGLDASIGLDVAATHFVDAAGDTYTLAAEGRALSSAGLIDVLATWTERYRIVSIEDGLAEDDWSGWIALTERLPRAQLIGDDLFATNDERLRQGIDSRAGNAVLVKPNQAGTLSEALAVMQLARTAGYATIVSARSGETEDSFIADLAVGTAAGQVKVGSVTRSSRLSKWNQLLRIEEELGVQAYVGRAGLR
jgi:enolase